MQRSTLKILLAIILLLSPVLILAQSPSITSTTSYAGLSAFAGKIIPHDDTLKPITNSLVKGVRAYSALQKIEGFNSDLNNSHFVLGISTIYINLGDIDRLGKAYGVQPTLNWKIYNKGRFNVEMNAGLGISYLTKTFSNNFNPENVAISTHLNYWGMISLNTTYSISNQISIGLGLETHHFSNGAIRKPNYGLNIIASSINVTYYFKALSFKPISFNPNSNKFVPGTLLISIGTGIKETGGAGGPKYYPVSFTIQNNTWSKGFKAFGYGINITYDKSTRFHKRAKNLNYSSPNDDIQTGLFFAGTLTLDKLSFYTHLGAYLYNPNPRLPWHYQKFGIRYNFFKNLFFQCELKTHLNSADHVGIGLGITI